MAMAFLVVERSVSLQMIQAPQVATKKDDCENKCKFLGGMQCAEDQPFAKGDPHLMNIKGDRFDIMRTGVTTLLEHPRRSDSRKFHDPDLRVEASVENPTNKSMCKGFFILRMWISGTLLGENIELRTRGMDLSHPSAMVVKIGNKTMRKSSEITSFVTNGRYKLAFHDERDHLAPRHPFNRIKFATLTIRLASMGFEVNWFVGKRLSNRLDFKALHVSKLGQDWGGLLGNDDHTWVSSFDPLCRKSRDFNTATKLLIDPDVYPWNAVALYD